MGISLRSVDTQVIGCLRFC